MTKNLVLDAQLSKDSYTVNNSGTGIVAGFTRIQVVTYVQPTTIATGSNFAAQIGIKGSSLDSMGSIGVVAVASLDDVLESDKYAQNLMNDCMNSANDAMWICAA